MKTFNINFIFVRHGFACHNALRPLNKNGVTTATSIRDFGLMSDPELTPLGVDATIHNGCILESTLQNLWKINDDHRLKIKNIDVVGSSPLIRSMESAFYMTQNWESFNKVSKFHVFPYLREIDESGKDKNSPESIYRMNTQPSYRMKSTIEQQMYLAKEGLLPFFDFSQVNNFPYERESPGDILRFIKWFTKYFLASSPQLKEKSNINVLIVTHAGVLYEYAREGFTNNSGFVMNTTVEYKKTHNSTRTVYNGYYPLHMYTPKNFFTDYNNPVFASKDYYCPSKRCGNLCYGSNSTDTLKHMSSDCKKQ